MKNIIIIILLAITVGAKAQQENQYTQFMWNTQMYNPGYCGSKGNPSLTALYRKQWIGFPGAPSSQLISFNSPFFNDRVGFGITLSHHSIGIQDNIYANMAYSYSMVKAENFAFRIGIQGSIKSYNINFADAYNVTTVDPYFINTGGDKALTLDRLRLLKGNFGVGLYFNYKDSYLGISSPNIYNNVIGNNGDPNFEGSSAIEQAHFYVMGGVMIPAGSKFHIKPAFMAKYVQNAPFDLDANLSVFYNLKFSVGASYRLGGSGNGESIDFLTFWQATDALGIGAAYDFTLSKLQKYNSGSIEIVARYDFGKKSIDMTNPRFFF